MDTKVELEKKIEPARLHAISNTGGLSRAAVEFVWLLLATKTRLLMMIELM